MKLKLTRPLVFFDLETTGLKIATDRIVEISLMKIFPDHSEEKMHHLVNPVIPITEEASSIHGITKDAIKHAPFFSDIAQEVSDFIEGCDLAGYNALRFDIPLLAEELLRAKIEFDIQNRKLIDVQNLFMKMEPRTLNAAYRFYCGKELKNAHSAEADVKASFEILEAQLDRYKNEIIEDENGKLIKPIVNDVEALAEFSKQFERADLAGHLIYNKLGEICFNFGKHKNKAVEDLFAKEPSYYDWIMRSEFPLYTKKVLTQIRSNMQNR